MYPMHEECKNKKKSEICLSAVEYVIYQESICGRAYQVNNHENGYEQHVT